MISYSEFRDLTPIDDIENGDEYINALKWAFQNKKIKNIALTGPYGAGKSSIIETFLRLDDKDAEGKIRKSALRISMATFWKGNESDNEHNGKIKIDADEVEKGILKQLFYKVKPNKIPQSRYRKLHPVNKKDKFPCIFAMVCMLMFCTTAYSPVIYNKLIDQIVVLALAIFHAQISSMIAGGILLIVSSCFITCLYCKVISNFRVKEIKLPTDTIVRNGAEETDSVFNRNLDEIMYFFEETGYKTVFLEDLDRLDDPKIFIHLRELNNLLNNDDAISEKPIVFVYAVRDDIFSREDRTKFFDFIIPVIPVINATNSGEILLQMLQEAKDNGINHDISQGFVLDVSPFISDMRILQNIYNEFIVYKNTLRNSQDLLLLDEQMLAIIIFKNLYPRDFADIQAEDGIIKKAILDKGNFVANRNVCIKDEIDNYSGVILGAQKDTCKSIKEIKYAMLCDLMDGINLFKGFYIDRYSHTKLDARDIM